MTHALGISDGRPGILGVDELAVDHHSYPRRVANVLGLLGIVVFIVAMISLAAGVTWLVVRLSPNPNKKPKTS
jgi:hypothetical protein